MDEIFKVIHVFQQVISIKWIFVVLGVSILAGVMMYSILIHEQRKIARLGRFCDNPTCVFHNRPVNTKGFYEVHTRKVFTRVIPASSSVNIRYCDVCREAVEHWKRN